MSEAPAPVSRRQWMHGLLTREEGGLAGRVLRALLVVQIIVSVAAAMLKTVPEIGRSYALALDAVLVLSTLGFAIEYALRIWIAPEDGGDANPAQARLRYLRSAPGLVDLIAAIPFALGSYVGLNLDWLDIMPIFKLLRHTAAFHLLVEAVHAERRVLGSAAILMVALLVFFSSLVYYLEREAQPKAFSSIPAALWWGIITLTTVGYGDITPVTAWGKFFGGITTIFGLCMFAIPVGIIASAFIEAVRRREFVNTWNLVAKVPMFRLLDASRIAAVAGVLRSRRAERGECLIRRGDVGDSMYFIVSGQVEVDPGAGAARRRLQSGDFFGEVALITERPRTATVTALSLCRLLVLEKDDFEAFMESYPELKAAVGAAAAKRLAEIDAAAR